MSSITKGSSQECPHCHQVYWPGSHIGDYQYLRDKLEKAEQRLEREVSDLVKKFFLRHPYCTGLNQLYII
jgi:uncharacterized protein with PIN domain